MASLPLTSSFGKATKRFYFSPTASRKAINYASLGRLLSNFHGVHPAIEYLYASKLTH